MEDKPFDVGEISQLPVGDPVPVYRDSEMTCAYLYNSLWEACLVDEESMKIDTEMADELISPLLDYLTAMLFLRWALSADVDMEMSLEDKVCTVLTDHEMSNIPFDIWNGEFSSDHNRDSFVFNDDDKLSVWLGECLAQSASQLSGFGAYGNYSDIDNELIWSLGKSPIDPKRPCFKESGWDVARDAIFSQFSIIRYSLEDAKLEFALIEADKNMGHSYEKEMEWTNLDACEVKEFARKAHGIRSCGIVIVPKGDHAGKLGYSFAEMLTWLDVMPEGMQRILAIGCGNDSFSRSKLEQFVDGLGLPVLFDGVFDDQGPFDTELGGQVEYGVGTIWQSMEWGYVGKLPESTVKKMDSVLSEIAVGWLVDIVCRPTASERASAQNGGEDAPVWSYASKSKLEYEYGEYVSSALTFGHVAVQVNSTMNFDEAAFYSKYRNFLESRERLDNAHTPEYDMMVAAKELLEREEELVPTEQPMRAFTYIPEDDRLDDDMRRKFEQRVKNVVAIAEAAGIPSALDAFAAGVPLDDILA